MGVMQKGQGRGTSIRQERKALFSFPAVLLLLLLVSSPVHARENDRSKETPAGARKIGLALGGGGARGMAHIGVIMALEEEGIPIDLVAGTSAGSIIGGLFAAGYSGKEMRAIMNSLNWKNVFREAPFPKAMWVSQRYGSRHPLLRLHFAFWRIFLPHGLINGQHISEELFRLTAAANYAAGSVFDNLVVPFRPVAVDISTGTLYALQKGNLPQAIRASTAIPGLYYPVIFDDKLMVDGGVLDIVPTDIVKEMGAEVVIAVKVNQTLAKGKEPQSLIGILENMLDIMIAELGKEKLALADLVIEPDLGTHSSYDYTGLDPIIEEGYKAAKQRMGEIRELVERNIGRDVCPGRKLDTQALEKAKVSEIRIIDHTIGPGKKDKDGNRKQPEISPFAGRKLILRYFPISPGKEFSIKDALKGVEDLYATGLFQNVWLELENPGDEKVEVNIHCLQGSNRFIGLGGSFRNEDGLDGFLQLAPFNLFRLGDRIMPLFSYGKLEMSAGLEISIGQFLLSPFSFDTGLYYEKEKPYLYSDTGDKLGQFDFDRVLTDLSFRYQPSKRLLFTLGFRGGHIWLGNDPLSGINAGSLNYLSVYGRAVFDNLDDMYFPTKGIQMTLENETILATSSKGRYFNKFSGTVSWTRSFFWKQTITPFSSWGLSSTSLPVYEKFRAGGPTDLPGYHRHEVWGNNMIIFGLKHRIRIYGSFNLQTILSVASVFDRLAGLRAGDFITGISTGLAFPSPLGPISLMYGWSRSGRNQYYLSVGYNF
jgi:NTE family protein